MQFCVAGGPAPGINTVIGTVAKVFLKDRYRVIGMNGGFEGLFNSNPDVVKIDFAMADNIFKQGGSALRMSRFKPTNLDELNKGFFVKKTKSGFWLPLVAMTPLPRPRASRII